MTDCSRCHSHLKTPHGVKRRQTSPETIYLLTFSLCTTLLFSLPDRFLLRTLHHLSRISTLHSTSKETGLKYYLPGSSTLPLTSSLHITCVHSTGSCTHCLTFLLTMLVNRGRKNSLVVPNLHTAYCIMLLNWLSW